MTKLEELEKRLENMKTYHKSVWNEYGSELCAGDMLRKEKEIMDEIKELLDSPETENIK